MASNTKSNRKKKMGTPEVKVAVIGAPSVGKSALTVRFMTKRYIGEYDHKHEGKYMYALQTDVEPSQFEIFDTCTQVRDSEITEQPSPDEREFVRANSRIKSPTEMPNQDVVQWAEGLVLVYSITDRESFNYIKNAKQKLQPDIPMSLVGNKADMVHLRQVSPEEGEILAKDFECPFMEVAVAEQVHQINEVFLELGREVLAHRRRTKHSLLNRMLGAKTTYRVYSRGKSDSALPKD